LEALVEGTEHFSEREVAVEARSSGMCYSEFELDQEQKDKPGC
jgi:hypothetical protein